MTRSTTTGTIYSILALGFAVAGVDKLAGVGGYRDLFRHWGWSPTAMRAVGVGEVTGALLLVPPPTRRLGGLLLVGTSAAVLSAELRRHEGKLGLPRLGLLLAAATALLPGAR